MATVVVYTDKGEQVWQMTGISSWLLTALQCPTNVRGSALAAGIRRAVQDAEVLEAGGDPERPSEKAMRLAAEERARVHVDPNVEDMLRRIHKAEPRSELDLHCKVCGQFVKLVPGGQRTTWVHLDSGAVVAPNP